MKSKYYFRALLIINIILAFFLLVQGIFALFPIVRFYYSAVVDNPTIFYEFNFAHQLLIYGIKVVLSFILAIPLSFIIKSYCEK